MTREEFEKTWHWGGSEEDPQRWRFRHDLSALLSRAHREAVSDLALAVLRFLNATTKKDGYSFECGLCGGRTVCQVHDGLYFHHDNCPAKSLTEAWERFDAKESGR